jgi:hypothetical protein
MQNMRQHVAPKIIKKLCSTCTIKGRNENFFGAQGEFLHQKNAKIKF